MGENAAWHTRKGARIGDKMKKSKLQTQLQKVIADNAQQLAELCKLRSENKQLRQQVQQLEDAEEQLKQSTIRIGRWNLEHGNAIEVAEKLRGENKQLADSYDFLDGEIDDWVEMYAELEMESEAAQADVARMKIEIATLEQVIVLAVKRE